jgi:hypothetical protein
MNEVLLRVDVLATQLTAYGNWRYISPGRHEIFDLGSRIILDTHSVYVVLSTPIKTCVSKEGIASFVECANIRQIVNFQFSFGFVFFSHACM